MAIIRRNPIVFGSAAVGVIVLLGLLIAYGAGAPPFGTVSDSAPATGGNEWMEVPVEGGNQWIDVPVSGGNSWATSDLISEYRLSSVEYYEPFQIREIQDFNGDDDIMILKLVISDDFTNLGWASQPTVGDYTLEAYDADGNLVADWVMSNADVQKLEETEDNSYIVTFKYESIQSQIRE